MRPTTISAIKRHLFSLLALGFAVLNLRAEACSCGGGLPPLREKAASVAVFSGKVKSITEKKRDLGAGGFLIGYDVVFELKQVFKGKGLEKLKKATLFTGTGQGDCGYYFEVDHDYLVYGEGKMPNLETHICTRTAPLEEVADDILELQGKQPKFTGPPKPPELVLTGKIDDAGYKGYVFELRNYLHERIWYSGQRTQIFRNGQWEDYELNHDVQPHPEPTPEEVVASVSQARKYEVITEEEAVKRKMRGLAFLGRVAARREFAPAQSGKWPWRIGFQFETETQLEAGKRIYKSKTVVWGPRIDAATEAKPMKFEEAFGLRGYIPLPLGGPKEGP